MRLLPALLFLALAGCEPAGGGDYPAILPLSPILAAAEPPEATGDEALEARAAALRARAAALRRAEP
jgi:hypothetical protein